jgi:hypothetical protein
MANDSLKILEQLGERKQENFDRLHSAELMNIGKNLDANEQADVCKVISSKILKEELERRIIAVDNILDELVARTSEYKKSMTLIQKEEFLAEIRQIVRA